MRNAIVCFEHRPSRGLMTLLRPGFRHCCVCIPIERRWLVLDPADRKLECRPVGEADPVTLCAGLAAAGAAAVLLAAPDHPRAPALRLRPLTCVELVKRALGLGFLPCVTPWRLFEVLSTLSRDRC